jgi:hypothetical protein
LVVVNPKKLFEYGTSVSPSPKPAVISLIVIKPGELSRVLYGLPARTLSCADTEMDKENSTIKIRERVKYLIDQSLII